MGQWDSWEDDAIVQNKATSLFAVPEKVRRTGFEGRFCRSRGPFTVHAHREAARRHPASRPERIEDKDFGAQSGELIFVVYPNIEIGRRDYADLEAEWCASAAIRGTSKSHN